MSQTLTHKHTYAHTLTHRCFSGPTMEKSSISPCSGPPAGSSGTVKSLPLNPQPAVV